LRDDFPQSRKPVRSDRFTMTIGLVDHFNIVISQSQVEETLKFYR